MVHVTISGQPGSGTSTIVALLENHFSWKSLNGGQVFRDEAEKRGMDLASFGKLCAEDLSVDRMLDDELKTRMIAVDGPQIVESRLAGRWAHDLGIDCVRIWIEVTLEERAKRIVTREGGTVEQRLIEAKTRSEMDQSRFSELYGINMSDLEPYSNIIQGDGLDTESVFSEVINILEKRGIANV